MLEAATPGSKQLGQGWSRFSFGQRWLAFLLVVCAASIGSALVSSAASGATLFGMYPGLSYVPDVPDNLVDASNGWLGKTNAIVNIFVPLEATAAEDGDLGGGSNPLGSLGEELQSIWAQGSIPMISLAPGPTSDA